MLHLIHPALVHFSVALIVLGGVAEAVGIVAARESVVRWGGQLLLLGLVGLVPTIVSGYLAANTVTVPAGASELLDAHERNGLILLGLLLGGQFWKAWRGGRLVGGEARLYAVLLLATVATTVYGAWLGGQMVYVQGIGVR